MNRLANATSPYLLQHKDNPVDWREWGAQALSEARSLDKPILLSIGYAACHWCHVMAHESFENDTIAALMNDLYIPIKVDREERPDIDHLYMSALHALGEQGGWPLTMFLLPDGRPFWGGTYFPPAPRYGRPGFPQILTQIATLYREQREKLLGNAQALTAALRQLDRPASESVSLTDQLVGNAASSLTQAYDSVHGGLRGAPKFPNPAMLDLLWRAGEAHDQPDWQKPALITLRHMALGGIHDHLGGGFARYSVDAQWLVPHFEKMLYDNALLLPLYARAYRQEATPLFLQAAEGIVAWLEREMVNPQGGFCASLDADSLDDTGHAHEGLFYVWKPDDIAAILGPADAAFFCHWYDISEDGNFEGQSIPNRLEHAQAPPETESRLATMRQQLLGARSSRNRPGLDDKILADWNGLMITGLIEAARLLDRPNWITLAERAFHFIAESMQQDNRLGHSWRAGKLLRQGFALDYAAMAQAALALHEATGHPAMLEQARHWLETLLKEHRLENGLLAMAAEDAPGETTGMGLRLAPTHDDAIPNAHAVALNAMIRLAVLSGDLTWLDASQALFDATAPAVMAQPLAHCGIMSAYDLLTRHAAIVVLATPDHPLARMALSLPAHSCIVSIVADRQQLPDNHPIRSAPQPNEPVAYLCTRNACGPAIADPHALKEAVLGHAAQKWKPVL